MIHVKRKEEKKRERNTIILSATKDQVSYRQHWDGKGYQMRSAGKNPGSRKNIKSNI